MKVILLRDVAKIGRRNQIVEVPDGFALNKLIPRREAEIATPSNLKKIANLNNVNEASEAQIFENLKKVSDYTTRSPLVIAMQANDKGHLFQSVHAEDIIEAGKKARLNISKEYIVITNPIKDIGDKQIELHHHGKKFELSIKVIAK
jgi:large subunit ribosomal protein L9